MKPFFHPTSVSQRSVTKLAVGSQSATKLRIGWPEGDGAGLYSVMFWPNTSVVVVVRGGSPWGAGGGVRRGGGVGGRRVGRGGAVTCI